MLVGQYDYAIDAKGRLNFPARFREEMGENFVVTRWIDDCLIALPQDRWQKLVDQLSSYNMADAQDLARRLLPSAMEAVPDKQGRILLTPRLRRHAHLEKDVTIVGMGSYAEIWDTALWEKREEEQDEGGLAEAVRIMNIHG